MVRFKLASRIAAFCIATMLCVAACANGAPGGGGDAGGSGSAPGEFVDGVLQPLADGFPKSPLTIVVPDAAGSDDGLYARAIKEAASSMSPVDIRVVDRPDFGTYGSWEALRWMEDQRGANDGYYALASVIPGSTFDLLTTRVGPDLGVTVETMNMVGITEQVPFFIVSRTGAPWGDSFESMLQWARENPEQLRHITIDPGSQVNMAMAAYAHDADISIKTSVGGGLAEVLTAIGAGSGDVAVTLPGQVSAFLDSGRIEVLSCTGSVNPCPGPWPALPNAATVLGVDGDEFGSQRGLSVTEGTPVEHREWLATLLQAVAEDEAFRKTREQTTPGLAHAWLDHDQSLQVANDALVSGKDILGPLGLLQEGAK
jgi:tripartite-type tricarboxylate transporter receptor subunit TctC